jgi:hypothetical protein
MSRILRRPMFRGGRVDSRGTGITSGLSYKKGGRVNYQMGGNVRGGIVNLPGGYNQTANERLNLWKTELEKTKLEQPGVQLYKEPYIQSQWDKFKDKIYTGGIHDVDLEYGMQLIPPPSIEEKNIMKLIGMGKEPELYEMFKSGDLPGSTIDYGTRKAEQMKANPELFSDEEKIETPEEGETREQFEARIRREAAEELQALLNAETEKDPAEEIAKNKKIFQEAYGSGLADEASTMALSLAGKMLKPGATVKSGFGEFFEAEAGRPSTRKKYLDAATTAAINAYLTGEKSIADFERALKLNKAKISDQISMTKGLKDWQDYLKEGTGTGDKKTSMGSMIYAVEKMNEAGKIDATWGGLLPDDPSQYQEGLIYVQENPDGGKLLVEWDGEKLFTHTPVYK